MTPEEQDGAIAFGTLMVVLLGIGLLRELLPFGLSSSVPPVLRLGFGRARLDSFTGIVTNLRRRDVTTSTLWEKVSAAGERTQFWTVTTIRHEEFDLVDASGASYPVHTTHAAFEGNTMGEFDRHVNRPLTAVWATRRFRKQGRYILFHEPGSQSDVQVAATNSNLSKLLAPRGWTVLPAMGLGFVIGSSTDLLGGHMVSGSLRGLGVAVLTAFAWLAVYFAIGAVRRGRFDRREIPRLRAIIDAPAP
jgi:hypothetical protein